MKMEILRTGVTTSVYCCGGADADYKKMAAHGYSCADFSALCDTEGELYRMNGSDFEKALLDEKKRANDAGITFSQVHGSWPVDDTTAEKRAKNLEFMKLCVRGTAILGCKNLVVHPLMPFSWGDETDSDFAEKVNEEFFRSLCEYAENYGVNICIENMPTKKHRLAGTEALCAFVKKLGYSNFFMCLDTGHCLVRGEDIGETARICAENGVLKVLHVHDNKGTYDDHLFPYMGKADWNSFKAALAQTGFDGCVSMEASVNKSASTELYEEMQKLLAATARELAAVER